VEGECAIAAPLLFITLTDTKVEQCLLRQSLFFPLRGGLIRLFLCDLGTLPLSSFGGVSLKNLSSILALIVALTCTNLKTVNAYDGAEVFDIQKGEVVKLISNSTFLQREVGRWLDSISGHVGSLKVEPDIGIGVKIVLTPPQNIKNQWINGTVTEVVLLISRTETFYPTLLVFTKENSVVAVNIHFDLMTFLKMNNLYDPELNLKSPNPISL
jgi:hypothetical protein